jgi:hypothetical protein
MTAHRRLDSGVNPRDVLVGQEDGHGHADRERRRLERAAVGRGCARALADWSDPEEARTLAERLAKRR